MLGVLRLSDQVVPLLAIVALTARIGDRQAVLDLMTNERTKRSASESQGGRTLDESNTHRRLLHLIANVRVAVAVETVLHVALDTRFSFKISQGEGLPYFLVIFASRAACKAFCRSSSSRSSSSSSTWISWINSSL